MTSGALTGLPCRMQAHIEAMSGVTMARLACFARDNGLTGLEFAHGIPGTVGGGVYMNAGAYGGEIRTVCRWSQEMLPDGTLVRREGVSQGFGHPTSVFQHRRRDRPGVLCPAAGRPRHHPRDDARADDAPHRLAAAGPALGRKRLQTPAGRLCRRAHRVCRAEGPDGRRRAQVSEKHAGFVVNRGGATAADVLELLRQGAAARSGAQRHPARAGNSPLGLREHMSFTIFSFGFRYGAPEADEVFDLRCLKNPYWEPGAA